MKTVISKKELKVSQKTLELVKKNRTKKSLMEQTLSKKAKHWKK